MASSLPGFPPSLEFPAFAAALAGSYAIEREIGRGGMGVVYLARDLRLDRMVAIKTLPPLLAMDSALRERFLREARTAARLSHPNIVPIHRADELGGQVFFVMGYVDGESLAQRLRSAGPLSPAETLRVMRDVAHALGYAHANGVIHRDVKAENILIDRQSGRAMVTDFGIARLAEATPLTATGQVLGTVYYLSPEQAAGEAVDGRSDLYALGVAGFLAISGRFPFDNALASAVLVAHVTKPAPSLSSIVSGIPNGMARIVDRLLAKSPADRFQSGDEVARALDEARGETERAGQVALAASIAPLVSDTEAQAIWKRAAELQSLTSAQAVVLKAPKRDAAADAARVSGYHMDDVRDSAREAGIPTQFVERAIAERGFGRAAANKSEVVVRDLAYPPERPQRTLRLAGPYDLTFLGAPTRLQFECTVDGEMPVSEYDAIAEFVSRRLGEVGSMSAVGRSFTWYSLGGRSGGPSLQITVVPRNGKTTIHVAENVRQAAGGIFGGIMGGGGMGIGSAVFAALMSHGPHAAANPAGALVGWGGVLLTMYTVARGAFGGIVLRKRKKLRSLAEELAQLVQDLAR